MPVKVIKRNKSLIVGLVFAALPLLSHSAYAAKSIGSHKATSHAYTSHSASRGRQVAHSSSGKHGKNARRGHEVASRGISCVPFARNESGIDVPGNAADWWDNAAGVYARGTTPQTGSVLNFRANGHMHLGHVAVVTELVDSRHIEIDHANWAGPGGGRGRVSREVDVVDVSPNNDWTAVRVALGHSGDYGSIYPTYGFIYDRPDTGLLIASASARTLTTPVPTMNPAPRDLRPRMRDASATRVIGFDEVAEAPSR